MAVDVDVDVVDLVEIGVSVFLRLVLNCDVDKVLGNCVELKTAGALVLLSALSLFFVSMLLSIISCGLIFVYSFPTFATLAVANSVVLFVVGRSVVVVVVKVVVFLVVEVVVGIVVVVVVEDVVLVGEVLLVLAEVEVVVDVLDEDVVVDVDDVVVLVDIGVEFAEVEIIELSVFVDVAFIPPLVDCEISSIVVYLLVLNCGKD